MELIGLLTWEHIIMGMVIIVFLIGIVMAVLYLSNRWFDAEKNNMLWGKLMSMMVYAEQSITGDNMGIARLSKVEELATTTLNLTEITEIEKRGGISKVVKALLPIVKLILPMIFIKRVK